MTAAIMLRAVDFDGPERWRWELSDADGALIAAHDVRLDGADWRYEAFGDLYGYLQWRAAPDRRLAAETEIVEEVGRWAGEQVFGPVGAALADRAPLTVLVDVPDAAHLVAYRPLELAHVRGTPLVSHGVSLVLRVGTEPPRAARPVEERLRVLGLFSLPVGSSALNLRKERHELTALLRRIAAVGGRAVELRALQYGVTPDRLREVVEDGDGWDVLHLSGHGDRGGFLLENPDGTPLPVPAEQLADWLRPLGERLKLAVLSSCSSAALTAAEHLRVLGLEPSVRANPPADVDEPMRETPPPTLAAALTGRLGCAVVAMRYPVADEFAIALGNGLYERLIRHGQPLATALTRAVREAVAVPPTPDRPPLSVATPALFGSSARDLRLSAPRERPPAFAEEVKLRDLPPQPDRFVGRVGVMATASEVLAPESRRSGLVLHGMAGAGKTSCAAELAYTHADTFPAVVWYEAPEESQDITGALSGLALRLEGHIEGLRLVHLLDDDAALRAELPKLTEYLERKRVLVVVDNAETLLTAAGEWRDPRWSSMVDALTAHQGYSRLVVTSRVRLVGLRPGVDVQPIHALSRDEAVLLTRELPNLRALMDGTARVDVDAGRRLVVRVLAAAQGHPKLLELADAQAADRTLLSGLTAAAAGVWDGADRSPDDFLRTGEPGTAAEDYLAVLRIWTERIVGRLSASVRDLFAFLCCLEPADRHVGVAIRTWPALRERLRRSVRASDVTAGTAVLRAQGLLEVHQGGAYEIHPGVAGAGRAMAGPEFREAVDAELGAFWSEQMEAAGAPGPHQGSEEMVAGMGLSAVPYLLRLGRSEQAGRALGIAVTRNPTRETAFQALPTLRRLLEEAMGTEEETEAHGRLARALKHVDPAAAERHVRAAREAALRQGNHWNIAAAAVELVDVCLHNGDANEALRFAEEAIDHSRRAGAGPWTVLIGELARVKALLLLGRMAEGLAEIDRLWRRVDEIPADGGPVEAVRPRQVVEELLGIGVAAATQLGQSEQALRMHEDRIAAMRGRDADADEILWVEVSICGLLMELDRVEEARAILERSRAAFARSGDLRRLGAILGHLADAEAARGHPEVAVGLRRDALRYAYAQGLASAPLHDHYRLAEQLEQTGETAGAVAHFLAAAAIGAVAGMEWAMSGGARRAGRLIRGSADADIAPGDLADLCRRVGTVPGVALDALLERLVPAPERRESLWAGIVAAAQGPDLVADGAFAAANLAAWEAAIAGILAARTDPEAASAIDAHLVSCAENLFIAPLATALRRIRAGERDERLLEDLEPWARAVVSRALDALAGRVAVPVELWHAIPAGPLLGDIVLALCGHSEADARALRQLDDLTRRRWRPALVRVLREIFDGARAPEAGAGLEDPLDRAIVAVVLANV
ncbi:hypothetical protein GCM10023195_87150 [Actinoallomurus liliacearum]|uniref:CHAT domain-containing protein n=1 Tax=Actinoallomurus liliacearum TaxID=1080073 RepID=A0ABP8U238_9ACTN